MFNLEYLKKNNQAQKKLSLVTVISISLHNFLRNVTSLHTNTSYEIIDTYINDKLIAPFVIVLIGKSYERAAASGARLAVIIVSGYLFKFVLNSKRFLCNVHDKQ